MSLLSKAEVQFLQGGKAVSKSYEYKLKSMIKRKVANLVDNELPLLSSSHEFRIVKSSNTDVMENNDLTKNGKVVGTYSDKQHSNLTESSKEFNQQPSQNTIKAPGPGFEPGSRE